MESVDIIKKGLRKSNSDIDFGKLPPQAKEIEEVVLGALMIEEKAINDVIDILKDETFYVDAHQRIYRAITFLYQINSPIDILTVSEQLKKTGELDIIGGAFYLVRLTNSVASAGNIETHALILKEKYLRRKLIQICTEIAQKSYMEDEDIFNTLSENITKIDALNAEINKLSQITWYEQVANRAHELKHAAENGYKTGLISGLESLDRQTLGFQPSDLIILAARPAMGKTALALHIAKEQAKQGMPVGVFSLEMSANQLIDRIFSSETEIDLQTIRKGGLHRDQWSKLDEQTLKVMEFPMYVCDKGGLSITEIVGIAKGWKLRHDIKALYVDYIQLITGGGTKGQNREQEVSEISRKLKVLAKELNIPVIALSQLSRACEARSDKRPMLSDLRESGAIEQDADMVIFPFRPHYYDEQANPELCEIIIAKYRNGKTGMVEQRFQGNIQKFSELNKIPF